MSEDNNCEECQTYGLNYIYDNDNNIICICPYCPFKDNEEEKENEEKCQEK